MENEMKTKKAAKIVGTIAMVLGAFMAICVGNESHNELICRAIGTGLCLLGGWLAGYLTEDDNDEGKEQDDETDELD